MREGNRVFLRNTTIPITLEREHISSAQNIHNLEFEIVLNNR